MRIVRSVLSNLTTFFLALILAVTVWATAIRVSDPVENRILEIVVQTVGVPPDAELLDTPPDTALITVEGPVSALDQASPADYTGIIDLSETPFGETVVPIEIRGAIEQVEVLTAFPETADIRMEQIVTRDIPVSLQVRGEVARGHRQGEARVEPDTIQVTGLASRVNPLSESRIVVFVDDAREDITELRRPTFYDMEGNVASVVGLNLSPNEVEAVVPVSELTGFAEKPITVDWIGEPAQGYRLLNVDVEPSSVQVTGAPALLEGLRIQTESVVISGLVESESRQVALDLPQGVSMVDVQPVVVTVEIEPILSGDVVQRPVEVRALGAGLEATLEPEQVRVFLFGPLPVLDSLAEDDVRVTVDLLNLITGTHLLEPIVSVTANDVEVRSTQPPVVTVIISDVITVTDGLTETLPSLVSPSAVSGDQAPSLSPLAAAFALRPRALRWWRSDLLL
jgi:YbbR domain-containing protein